MQVTVWGVQDLTVKDVRGFYLNVREAIHRVSRTLHGGGGDGMVSDGGLRFRASTDLQPCK